MAFGSSQFSRLRERSLRTPGSLGQSSAHLSFGHTLLSGCKVPTNTGFRNRRGSEPRVLKLNYVRKVCKDFPKFTLIFPCKQENLAFVRRIRVLFLEKPKLFMGWPWSSSHSCQAVECPRTAPRYRREADAAVQHSQLCDGSSLLPIHP